MVACKCNFIALVREKNYRNVLLMHAILLILFVLVDFIVADRFIFLIYFLFVAAGPHAHSISLKSLPRLYYCYKAATIEDNNLGNLFVVWRREFTKHMNPQLEFFGKPEKLLDWWCLKWTSLSDVKRGIQVLKISMLRVWRREFSSKHHFNSTTDHFNSSLFSLDPLPDKENWWALCSRRKSFHH